MSVEDGSIRKQAQALKLLRQQRMTAMQLAEHTGAHRASVAKWIRAWSDAGLVRPNGSAKSGRGVALLWEAR